MPASLLLSIVLHVLVLAAALVSFGAHAPPKDAETISVAIAPPSAVSMTKAGTPKEAPDEAASKPPPADKPADVVPTAAEMRPPAETVAQKQAALPPPKPKAPPPAEAATKAEKQAPPPKPEAPAASEAKPAAAPPAPKKADAPKPRQEPPPKQEAKAKPEKQPEPKPRQRARDFIAELSERPTPPAEGKAEFNPNQIAALLNRDPTAGQRPSQDGPREPWRQPSSLQEQALGASPEPLPEREAHGDPAGRDARMSANDIDALRAQIARCWTPPVGGLGGDAIIVKLRIELNQDGTLARPPQLANSFDSPFFRPAADSAIRAVFQCQPYRMPADKFSQWRDMLLNFDPSRMFGG